MKIEIYLQEYALLETQDLATLLQQARPLDSSLVQRVHNLVGGLDVDLDKPLPSDDE